MFFFENNFAQINSNFRIIFKKFCKKLKIVKNRILSGEKTTRAQIFRHSLQKLEQKVEALALNKKMNSRN